MECSRFCKNSASFPVMCYLIDFIDIAHTVHNFIRRTKLISSFFKEEIELIISKITKFHNKITKFQNFISNLSWYLLKWQLTYFRVFPGYRTVQNQLFSGFKCLKIAGTFRVSFLDHIRGLTPADPIQSLMDPSCIGKVHHILAKR